MTKHVLLDCDGVLADFVSPVLEFANGFAESVDSSRRWRVEDMTKWNFLSEFDEVAGLRWAVEARIGSPGFCLALPVYAGAVEGVARLREIASVKVVTSPWHSSSWHHERVSWLVHHFGFAAKDVIFASDKRPILGSLLVDDNAETVDGWEAYQWDHAKVVGLGVVWAHPYNRDSTHPRRTNSWDHLLRVVAEHT